MEKGKWVKVVQCNRQDFIGLVGQITEDKNGEFAIMTIEGKHFSSFTEDNLVIVDRPKFKDIETPRKFSFMKVIDPKSKYMGKTVMVQGVYFDEKTQTIMVDVSVDNSELYERFALGQLRAFFVKASDITIAYKAAVDNLKRLVDFMNNMGRYKTATAFQEALHTITRYDVVIADIDEEF